MGADERLFAGALAPPGATMAFVFDDGVSGAMHVRHTRLGVEGRLVVARIGRLRPFVGFGAYSLSAQGKTESFAPPSSPGADDQYGVRAGLPASSVAPLLGAKWTLSEQRRPGGGHVAADLVFQGRIDLLTCEPTVEYTARTEAGLARAVTAAQQWNEALRRDLSSVAVSIDVAFVVRL